MDPKPFGPSPELRTFADWSNDGYRIKRGAKAVSYWGGQALFAPHQVYIPSRYYPGGDHDWEGGDHDWDGGGFWGDFVDATDANY